MPTQAAIRRSCPSLVWFGITVLLLAATAAPGAAQRGDVELRPRWQKGERQQLIVTKHQEQVQGETVRRRVSADSTVAIVVLESTAQGMVVEWTWGATTFSGTPAEQLELASEVANLMTGLRYELAVNPAGVVTGLRNFGDVKQRSDTALGLMVDRLRQRGLPDQMASRLGQTLATMFDSEQKMLAAMKEVAIYHAAFGRSYAVGVPLDYEMTLPNPFGGDALPAHSRFTLTRLDAPARRATIAWRQTVEPAAMARFSREAFGQLAPGAPPLTGVTLTLADEGEVVLDPGTGWVESARHTRTLVGGDIRRTDTLTLTRQP